MLLFTQFKNWRKIMEPNRQRQTPLQRKTRPRLQPSVFCLRKTSVLLTTLHRRKVDRPFVHSLFSLISPPLTPGFVVSIYRSRFTTQNYKVKKLTFLSCSPATVYIPRDHIPSAKGKEIAPQGAVCTRKLFHKTRLPTKSISLFFFCFHKIKHSSGIVSGISFGH